MTRIFRSAAVVLTFILAAPVLAQTAGEKVDAAANDGKRVVKKGANRVDETLCTGTKAECAAKKGKHRVGEKKDEVVDGAKKAVDKVD
jgi:ElaB/YqjD/DUF883 family membrane-anchored ribosome-binding protein